MSLRSHTIWADGALDNEPRKYRTLWRVWLPAYDFLCIMAGVLSSVFGSRTLNETFGAEWVPLIGIVFAAVAGAALVGVAFPALFRLEAVAKVVLIGMVGAYTFLIIFFPSEQQIILMNYPSFFVAAMLMTGLPLPCFRLSMLGDEEFQRKVDARAAQIKRENRDG